MFYKLSLLIPSKSAEYILKKTRLEEDHDLQIEEKTSVSYITLPTMVTENASGF